MVTSVLTNTTPSVRVRNLPARLFPLAGSLPPLCSSPAQHSSSLRS